MCREGERKADINTAENVHGLARVLEILRTEGDVGGDFVSGNSLLTPEIEDVELDGALIGGGIAGEVMSGCGVGGDYLRVGRRDGVAGVGRPALDHVCRGRGGAVADSVVGEHGPGGDFCGPVDGARGGGECAFCRQGSSLP